MSIQSWLDEFMSLPAHMATQSRIASVRHALRKWSGLLPANLERHGVLNACGYLCCDGDTKHVLGTVNCALCRHNEAYRNLCKDCPLAEFLRRPCFSNMSQELSVYAAGRAGNVEPMLIALEATLSREQFLSV